MLKTTFVNSIANFKTLHLSLTPSNRANMSSDESSELSSAPSDIESDVQLSNNDGILKFFTKTKKRPSCEVVSSPPRPKREPSPPHTYILADRPEIAFIVMFRSRFTDAFPKTLANFGPQELERDIVCTVPGETVEGFLCALLGLLLNRKQEVKSGHYNRALEEAIQTHKSQWPKTWEKKNPLSGNTTFLSMTPEQRLTLLRTLTLWALSSSDVIKGIIQSSYKQSRHEDDLNQPLSVQSWGSDSEKRRYYLIEGLDDTHFRVYRESYYMSEKISWWSVASNIDELKALAENLEMRDGGPKAKLFSGRILAAIPRFEAAEEKRKRREYRSTRKHQFKQLEPNYSYEGRTRGKRIKYTYSDDEETHAIANNSRRSTRNNGTHISQESNGPTITQSGRMVKSRQGGAYGETISGKTRSAAALIDYDILEKENNKDSGPCAGRPRRVTANNGLYAKQQNGPLEDLDEDDEISSEEEGDPNEPEYLDDGDDEHHESELEDPGDISDGEKDTEENPKKLIVKLPIRSPTPEQETQTEVPPSSENVSTSSVANGSLDEMTEKNDDVMELDTNTTINIGHLLPSHSENSLNQITRSNSPPAQHSITQSPSLILRATLENTPVFSTSVNVGCGT
ncbi:hypothetical protein K3495_g2597 [Podosphaera aphanis]|nr:hypothetical protein K3495_g2597 [Podosphaera aphanis]